MKSNQVGTCYQRVFLCPKKIYQLFIFGVLMLVDESISLNTLAGKNKAFSFFSVVILQEVIVHEEENSLIKLAAEIKDGPRYA